MNQFTLPEFKTKLKTLIQVTCRHFGLTKKWKSCCCCCSCCSILPSARTSFSTLFDKPSTSQNGKK